MVIKWLKKRYSLNDNNDVFERQNNSLEFVWVWSIFERFFLSNSDESSSYNVQLIELSAVIKTGDTELNDIYGTFYKRYYINKIFSEFYKNLNFDKKRNRICKDILSNRKPSNSDKIKLVFLVIYKYRCNLFHGGKEPLFLGKFDIIFLAINKFLCHIIDENPDAKGIRKLLKKKIMDE